MIWKCQSLEARRRSELQLQAKRRESLSNLEAAALKEAGLPTLQKGPSEASSRSVDSAEAAFNGASMFSATDLALNEDTGDANIPIPADIANDPEFAASGLMGSVDGTTEYGASAATRQYLVSTNNAHAQSARTHAHTHTRTHAHPHPHPRPHTHPRGRVLARQLLSSPIACDTILNPDLAKTAGLVERWFLEASRDVATPLIVHCGSSLARTIEMDDQLNKKLAALVQDTSALSRQVRKSAQQVRCSVVELKTGRHFEERERERERKKSPMLSQGPVHHVRRICDPQQTSRHRRNENAP